MVRPWLAVLSLLVPSGAPIPEDERPNLLVLLSDDQSVTALGFSGNEAIHTPHMDRLAGEGVYFDNAFVTTSICAVSRASLLTGQYARRTGIYGFREALTPEQLNQTYPALLRESGYYVGFIGKWGISPQRKGQVRAASALFDYWAGVPEQGAYWHTEACPFVQATDGKWHPCPCEDAGSAGERTLHTTTRVIPDKVAQFLERRPAERPFCLSISFKAPHGPWDEVPDEIASAYADRAVPVCPDAAAQYEQLPEFLRESAGVQSSRELVRDTATLAGLLRDYYATTAALDVSVGAVRAALRERDLEDDTVVIFTSDNGTTFGEHGYIGKWLMYEESIRVPLVVFDPRADESLRGRRSAEMALNVDLAPTLLELAGVPVPAAMQGQSWVPVLADKAATLREDWFYEHLRSNVPAVEGVRTRALKYVRYVDLVPVREELYDLRDDPGEHHDRSKDPGYAESVAALRARHAAYVRDL
jgi:arylsulfatase A-like enzyme